MEKNKAAFDHSLIKHSSFGTITFSEELTRQTDGQKEGSKGGKRKYTGVKATFCARNCGYIAF